MRFTTSSRRRAVSSLALSDMHSPAEVKALNLYADIMLELRNRVSWAEGTLAGDVISDEYLAQDFCFLQIRFACELLAVGCLVAHGDIQETGSKRFRDDWNASTLLDALERLHPDFFPIPVTLGTIETDVEGVRTSVHHYVPVVDGPTKGDLKRIYTSCGDALHRGSIGNLASKASAYKGRAKNILDDLNTITRLLSVHQISLLGNSSLFCHLFDENGNVSALRAERFGEPIEIAPHKPQAGQPAPE